MEIIENLSNGNIIVYNQLENGTCYHKDTPQAVIDILERSRYRGDRIRVFYGDTKTGKCWNEEHDVIGYVGRSTGRIKIPLLIYDKRSIGGGAMLDHCIIKIINKYCKTLYQHENFSTGKISLGLSDDNNFIETVKIDDKTHANFKKAGQAQRWIDFITGKRFSK